jgi:hypothetical protein
VRGFKEICMCYGDDYSVYSALCEHIYIILNRHRDQERIIKTCLQFCNIKWECFRYKITSIDNRKDFSCKLFQM